MSSIPRILLVAFIATSLGVASIPLHAQQTPPPETTPATLGGAETFVYREGKREPMRLHVFKPVDWKKEDHRPVFIFFFGGGWTRGTPTPFLVRAVTKSGFVGIAPDYRTNGRFGTTPLQSVADARAAVRWVQDHAGELGIDPAKVIVSGHSAGGHVALWTGIEKTPPGSNPDEAPKPRPAALVLLAPVSDTSPNTGYTPYRFGLDAVALSPQHQVDDAMPSTLLVHGDSDKVVPYAQSTRLKEAMTAKGAACELVTIPNGDHSFLWEMPEWNESVLLEKVIEPFLKQHGLWPQ